MGKVRIKQIGKTEEDVKPEETTTKPKSGVDKKKQDVPQRKPKQGKPVYPKQVHGRSARYKKTLDVLKTSELLPGPQAISLAKKTATASFPETIELHTVLNKDAKNQKYTTTLPHPTGKKRNVLILTASPNPLKKSLNSLSTLNSLTVNIAGPDKIDEIKKAGSPPDVDKIWATPDIMPKIAKIAPIIGPTGLMPNPKHGTIVKPDEVGEKLKSLAGGKITLETEKKSPVIHTVIGKANMPDKKLEENLAAVLKVLPAKKIKRIALSSTMGPAIQVELPE